MKIVSRNRRAEHKYALLERFEGGLVLTGPEIKSVRAGEVNLEDGFGRLDGGEVFLWNAHIKPYTQGSTHVVQYPTRRRKILLKRDEIKRLIGKLTIKGLTLVPLDIHLSDTGYAKVTLALAKGKSAPDRRDSIKKKSLQREMRRDFSGKQRL
jgi:SsrA-binding protein